MRLRPRLLPTLMILALGCASSPGPVSAPGSFSALEAEIVDRLNALRSREGLSALQPNAEATEVAREHSNAMASGKRAFGHDEFFKRVSHLAPRNPAENVFWSLRQSGLAEQVVQAWFDSPPHRKNMLGNHGALGIGAAKVGEGKLYVTGIFIR